MILENKVFQKLKLSKIILIKKCAPKVSFTIEKNQTDLRDDTVPHYIHKIPRVCMFIFDLKSCFLGPRQHIKK
jgi:hypothetical protein